MVRETELPSKKDLLCAPTLRAAGKVVKFDDRQQAVTIGRYMMTKQLIFLSLLLSVISCKAQLQYKDQMEFGFKGNIKVVTKKVYSNPIIEGDIVSLNLLLCEK